MDSDASREEPRPFKELLHENLILITETMGTFSFCFTFSFVNWRASDSSPTLKQNNKHLHPVKFAQRGENYLVLLKSRPIGEISGLSSDFSSFGEMLPCATTHHPVAFSISRVTQLSIPVQVGNKNWFRNDLLDLTIKTKVNQSGG
jgi:hypothetical protein